MVGSNFCPCVCLLEMEEKMIVLSQFSWVLNRIYFIAKIADLIAHEFVSVCWQRNIAILQQEVFEFSRRIRTAEAECCSLNLQLAEFKWTFNEMQKDADKAHRLQEQLNALQHVSIFGLETLSLKRDSAFYAIFDLCSFEKQA